MFQISVVFIAIFAVVNGAPKADQLVLATACVQSTCLLPDCRCSSTSIPNNLPATQIPQLVLFTFDDAITAANFEYYQEAFFSRTNPDGCSVQATYYMSHEYTDYSKVHELYARGHEIALHSITHEPSTQYWDELDVDGFLAEFADQRILASHFADISEQNIQGMRIPLLQLSGNSSFHAMQISGLKYDASWATQAYMNPPLWPYTLNYRSTQDCPIGVCPTASFPGIWVQPMVDWSDDSGYVCAMVDSCVFVPTDVPGILNFIKRNFHRHYNSNRAPFGFYLHSAWFLRNPNNFEAYLQFLDYLQTLNDVYIVSVQRALQWVQNPKPLGQLSSVWSSCPPTYQSTCTPKVCQLSKDSELRYMTQCRSSCPTAYPWLGNPLGQ